MNKTIILLVSNLKGGGAQRVVSNLSKILSAENHLFICLHDGRDISYPFKGRLIDLQIPPVHHWFIKIVNFTKRIIKFKKIRNKINPDYVISFMESSNFINLFSGHAGKTIISVRNYKAKRVKSVTGKVFKLLMKLFYKKSWKIVAVSEGIRENLIDHYSLEENKIEVIYNPVDLGYIREMAAKPLAVEHEPLFDYPVIITAGKMMRQKGQWHLIRAFSVIKKTIGVNLKLVILGDGVLRPYLVAQIKKLGLEDDVKLLGFQKNPFQYFYKASLFVLPSLFEGFPNALLEAMACGLPVIASDCPTGPREILAPESEKQNNINCIEYAPHGILVPPCDGEFHNNNGHLGREEQLLADAVIKLLTNPSHLASYREKSLSRAEDFSLEKIASYWVKMIG
jgi:glycosyltransferase involved in cell wall biosynthesis